jgi:hypothetical protein
MVVGVNGRSLADTNVFVYMWIRGSCNICFSFCPKFDVRIKPTKSHQY